MSQLQEKGPRSDAIEPAPHARRQLETELAELRARQAMLDQKIAAVDADMARPYGNGIYQLLLRSRQAELIAERDGVAALMETVVADTAKAPELRELHRQELQRRIEALTERIAALRADEEKAASITWADRQDELGARQDRLQAERRAVASEIADREARLQM